MSEANEITYYCLTPGYVAGARNAPSPSFKAMKKQANRMADQADMYATAYNNLATGDPSDWNKTPVGMQLLVHEMGTLTEAHMAAMPLCRVHWEMCVCVVLNTPDGQQKSVYDLTRVEFGPFDPTSVGIPTSA